MVEKTDTEAVVRKIKRRTRKINSMEEKVRIVLKGLRPVNESRHEPYSHSQLGDIDMGASLLLRRFVQPRLDHAHIDAPFTKCGSRDMVVTRLQVWNGLTLASLLLLFSFNCVCQVPFRTGSISLDHFPTQTSTTLLHTLGFEPIPASGTNPSSSDIEDRASAVSSLVDNAVSFTTDANATQLVPQIKTNIVQYRFTVYSKKNDSTGVTTKVVVPFFIIGKLSSDYARTSPALLSDAISLDGSPFAFRISPSINKKVGDENSFYLGSVIDMRAVAHNDTVARRTLVNFGYYQSLALRYSGPGDVTSGQEAYDGKWSASLMVFIFTSSNAVLSNIFDQAKLSTGLEGTFTFAVDNNEGSKYNLFLSIGWLWNNSPHGNVSPVLLKLGIGT